MPSSPLCCTAQLSCVQLCRTASSLPPLPPLPPLPSLLPAPPDAYPTPRSSSTQAPDPHHTASSLQPKSIPSTLLESHRLVPALPCCRSNPDPSGATDSNRPCAPVPCPCPPRTQPSSSPLLRAAQVSQGRTRQRSTAPGPASRLSGPASRLSGPASRLSGPSSRLSGPASRLSGHAPKSPHRPPAQALSLASLASFSQAPPQTRKQQHHSAFSLVSRRSRKGH